MPISSTKNEGLYEMMQIFLGGHTFLFVPYRMVVLVSLSNTNSKVFSFYSRFKSRALLILYVFCLF